MEATQLLLPSDRAAAQPATDSFLAQKGTYNDALLSNVAEIAWQNKAFSKSKYGGIYENE